MAVSISEEEVYQETRQVAPSALNPVVTVMSKSWQQLVTQGRLISQRPQVDVLLGWDLRSREPASSRRLRHRVISES